MNRSDLKCALTITTPYKQPEQSEVDIIFDVGERVMPVKQKNLSFIAFLMLADIYRAFSNMNQPIDSGYIRKRDLLRGLQELDVPNRMNETAGNEVFKGYGVEELGVSDFI